MFRLYNPEPVAGGRYVGGTALSALYVALEDVADLQARIGQLVVDAQLRFVLLMDSGGDVVCTSGDAVGYDVPALGALLAGHFAASREIARLLRERGFRVSVQQGHKAHLLTALIGERWLVGAV